MKDFKVLLCPQLKPVTEVASTPWFDIRNRGGYYTVEYPNPQVMVLATVDHEDVVMVKVARPVVGEDTWELPAGGCEPDESPEEGALREFCEETGIVADIKNLKRLKKATICPNRYPYEPYLFYINLSEAQWANRGEHDAEIKDVVRASPEVCRKMLLEGELHVSLPGMLIARHLLAKNSWGALEEVTNAN